jgi:hypothetical protein
MRWGVPDLPANDLQTVTFAATALLFCFQGGFL